MGLNDMSASRRERLRNIARVTGPLTPDPDADLAKPAAEHGLIVKTHWKSGAERLREQLRTSQQEAEKKATEPRDAFAIRAGIEAHVARAALDLLAEVLTAAEAAENALPIPLTLGQHLILEGKVLRVINAWEETEASDGRKRWGIVTEGEEQPTEELTADTPMREWLRAGGVTVAPEGEDQEEAHEWQPGECDYCVGASGQAELAAQMASAIVPVCACLMGQGAPLGECYCGPELFADRAGEGKPEEQPTEAGATAPTQDQG